MSKPGTVVSEDGHTMCKLDDGTGTYAYFVDNGDGTCTVSAAGEQQAQRIVAAPAPSAAAAEAE